MNHSREEWTSLSPMQSKRHECAAAAMDGRIYAIGGFDGSKKLSSMEAYDLISNEWTATSEHEAASLQVYIGPTYSCSIANLV
mmetsp:Transcript_5566/g.8449  ORF Transcript_5566/g.8449 Transcript_5566/m.8449 type:complete len:83 (+) Transcript_5566:270-518(+)